MDIYLKKIELHGFKSFPEKTVIKFHKGITAVVGPNGCGKSNLVDALLWVLGEQRIKNLRGENNEDLIFNGSVSKKPLGMTEVEAIITSVDEEVYIARRFYRNGEGKYILNDKYCRNKDIQDELFKLHLGGRNYFIFEQGSIDKLISLKPEEKRILIEEAADISQYLERKKETANKLIIAQQNLDNIEILTADKQDRLRELKNQVNYVERYRRIKNEKMEYLQGLLKKKYDFLGRDFDSLNREVEDLLNRETVLVKDMTFLEKELLAKEELRWKVDKELKEDQKEYFDTNREILTKKNEIDKLLQKKDFTDQKIIELEQAIKSGEQEKMGLRRQIEEQNHSIKELKDKLSAERQDGAQLNDKLIHLKKQNQEIQSEDSALKKQYFSLQAEVSQLNNNLQDLEKKVSRIENEVLAKKDFIAELDEEVKKDDISSMEMELIKLKQKLSQVRESYQRQEDECKKISEFINDLTNQLKNSENEKHNLQNQRVRYLEIKKKIQGQSQETADLKGHSFLQNILQADKKYHKILENFYYDEMDALVLKNNDDVFKINANKYLLGQSAVAKIPEEVKREAGYICQVKDLYSLRHKDFQLHLKNGILVNNIKNGMYLFVKYGLNVVTERAEIINSNGILIKNREKGILDVINEIRQIDLNIGDLRKKIAALQSQIQTEKTKQEQLESLLRNAKLELEKEEEKEIQWRTQLESLSTNKEKNIKRIEMNNSEIELLSLNIKKLKEEIKKGIEERAKLQKDLGIIEKKREGYQKRLDQLSKDTIAAEKIAIQNDNSLNLIKEKLNSASANSKILETSQTKLVNGIQTNQQTIVNLKDELIQIQSKLNKLGNSVDYMSTNKITIEGKIKTQENEFGGLKKEIAEKTAEVSHKRNQLEQIKETKNQAEIKLSSVKKDLFQLEEISFKELNTELKNLKFPDPVMDMEITELEEKVKNQDERLIRMRDSNRLNFSAESEFNLLSKDYDFLNNQKQDIIKSIEDMNQAIERIDKESMISFLNAFEKVQENFKKNFKILFEGGEAELILNEDEGNVLEAGLEIKAQPPGKRLQSLKLLSGGEKTLTSLAFLFAMFEYKPSPFCVFDEVDASLDEANIQKFLKFLHRLKQKTQFLIITHNFKTMEEADYLYGISMEEPGISTIYSLQMTGKGEFQPQPLK